MGIAEDCNTGHTIYDRPSPRIVVDSIFTADNESQKRTRFVDGRPCECYDCTCVNFVNGDPRLGVHIVVITMIVMGILLPMLVKTYQQRK